ncbi:MAG: ABC transporter ATP-binding protein [Candidatus Zixiibacteriota bacterium]
MSVSIEVDGIAKSFGDRKVLKDINFALSAPNSVGITGHNGSGKSTLMKILAQILSPTRGKVTVKQDGQPLAFDRHAEVIKMVAPEMALYEMLTAYENMQFFAKLAEAPMPRTEQDRLLDLMGLAGRGDDMVGAYSSGMKQRLKYAVALLAKPDILLLDEPTSNLDDEGKAIVVEIMERQKQDKILIIATNEHEDLGRVASIVELG